MSTPWKAALRYGSGPTTWAATISQRPWNHSRSYVGGSLEVASGSREAFTIRVDKLLQVTIRVLESELGTFLDAVDYGVQNPGSLTFYPNGTTGTGYAVYLVSPAHGEEYSVPRGETFGTFEAPLTLRRVDGQAWALDYFAGA